ncbi:hypothetical protein NDU88_006444 [Pleurodeles waltl]|uniref:Uncharacterized protein n=1 Tax=Pleurodeles waltl TaxID=8319 RepID=A0AAV7MZI2_PLEWA|nr:hypothetical protein NDU88_006444 [Pleurodeles waltl]
MVGDRMWCSIHTVCVCLCGLGHCVVAYRLRPITPADPDWDHHIGDKVKLSMHPAESDNGVVHLPSVSRRRSSIRMACPTAVRAVAPVDTSEAAQHALRSPPASVLPLSLSAHANALADTPFKAKVPPPPRPASLQPQRITTGRNMPHPL